MRYLFLNQYGPPDPSPTSRLLGELADFLREQGDTVCIISHQQDYHGRPPRGLERIRREMVALVSIGLKALRVKTKPDAVLALSSPPCLLPVAWLVSFFLRAPLAHWAMDLYPELALSLGEIKSKTIGSCLKLIMTWGYRRAQLVVALDSDMAAHLQGSYGIPVKVLPPWPARLPGRLEADRQTPSDNSVAPGSPGSRLASGSWTWLYSGNLGRAHEWRPLLETQKELERRRLPIQLLFEGGGAMWREGQACARELGLSNCCWTGYVTEIESFETLQASRLIVASQRREAQGFLWPSKLARIAPLDKPVLWIGPTDGAIARSLGGRPQTGCFEPDNTKAIADWIEGLFQATQGSVTFTQNVDAIFAGCIAKGCRAWDVWFREIAR